MILQTFLRVPMGPMKFRRRSEKAHMDPSRNVGRKYVSNPQKRFHIVVFTITISFTCLDRRVGVRGLLDKINQNRVIVL